MAVIINGAMRSFLGGATHQIGLGLNVSQMEYVYPDTASVPAVTLAQAQHYASRGITHIRLCISWPAWQPTLFGALDAVYTAKVKLALDACHAAGLKVLVDNHSYGYDNGIISGRPGQDPSVPTSAFVDFHVRLVTALTGYPGFWAQGLYNEPEGYVDLSTIPAIFDAATVGIRAVDQTVIVVCGGNHFSGAWDSNTQRPGGFANTDSANRTFYDAHSYPDRDSSGTHFNYPTEASVPGEAPPGISTNPTIFITRLSTFYGQLVLNSVPHVEGFLGIMGELGFSNSSENWFTTAQNGIDYARAHDLLVFLWAAGNAWGQYPQSMEPDADGLQAKGMALVTHYTGAAEPTIARLTGPWRATSGMASAPFSVEYRGNLSAPLVVTLTDSGAGGTFTPASPVLLAGRNPRVAFTYTPATQRIAQISAAIDGLTIVNDPVRTSSIVASISGTVLSVTQISGKIVTGQQLYGGGVAANTYVLGFLPNATGIEGSVGNYSVSVSQNISSTQFTTAGAQSAGNGVLICSSVSDPYKNISTAPAVIHSSTHRIISTWGGNSLIRLQRYDGLQQDFGATSLIDPRVDRTAIALWAGGTGAPIYLVKKYAQDGSGNDDIYQDLPFWQLDGGSGYPLEHRNPGCRSSYTAAISSGYTGQTLITRLSYLGGDPWLLPWTSNTLGSVGVFNGNYTTHTGATSGMGSGNTFNIANSLAVDGFHTYVWRFRADTTNGAQTIKDGIVTAQTTTTGGALTWDSSAVFEGYFIFVPSLRSLVDWTDTILIPGAISDFEELTIRVDNEAIYSTPWPTIVTPPGGYDPIIIPQQNTAWTSTTGKKVSPFISAPVADGSSGGTQLSVIDPNASTVSASITLSAANGSLTGPGLTGGPLVYLLPFQSAANLTKALIGDGNTLTPGVLFTPSSNGTTTTFALTVTTLGAKSATYNETTVTSVAIATLPTPYAMPTTAPLITNFKGVNISGGENGQDSTRPYGFDYFYGNQYEYDYWAGKGFGVIRMPLVSRRVEPYNYTDLLTAQLGHIKPLVDRAAANGQRVIFDLHSFGSVFSTFAYNASYFGYPTVEAEATNILVDFWRRLATLFKNYTNVIFGIMNEPNGSAGQTAAQWRDAAIAAYNAIRATGATQLILISGGPDFDGAHSWVATQGTLWDAWLATVPTNFAFEMHQYLDADNSGSNPEVVAGKGASVLIDATTWCRSRSVKAFLGEFGWSPNDSQPFGGVPSTEGTALVQYMKANNDVWQGWTYWLGGTDLFYSNYIFSGVPTYSGGVAIADPVQLPILQAAI